MCIYSMAEKMDVTSFILKCVALVIITAVVNGNISTSSFGNVLRVSQVSTGEKTIFDWKQVIRGVCLIELRSWGYDDNQRDGYALVNGELAVNYNRPNDEVRGINVNVLRASDCRTIDQRHFDTYQYPNHSIAMAKYLRSQTMGTIIYGVSCDEATTSLTVDARRALDEIGVDVSALVPRGKLTFVVVVGRPLSSVTSIGPNGGENLRMDAVVTRTAVPVIFRVLSEISSRESKKMDIVFISSIVLNGILIVSIVLVCIVKAVKRCVKSRTSKAIAPVPAAKAEGSREYAGLNRLNQGGAGSVSPGSYYEELPERSPIVMNKDGTTKVPVDKPNYLQLNN